MMTTGPSFPPGVSVESLLLELRELCWGAADILLAYARGTQPPFGFKRALNVDNSGEGPVSAADLAVNRWLLDGLQEKFPHSGWNLISEETSKEPLIQGTPLQEEWVWILDPLDGTKDFLQGTGEYAVHLALIKENRPVFGVVMLPELEELWFGVVDVGAWCEDRKGKRAFARFSNRRTLTELILLSSRNHRDERLDKLIERLRLGGTKAVGSVGCKIASILRGESDLYISLSSRTAPKDWDMAAPEAILLAAGGRFTHADGNPLEYSNGNFLQKGCLIASHGFNHSLLCQKALNAMNLIDPCFKV